MVAPIEKLRKRSNQGPSNRARTDVPSLHGAPGVSPWDAVELNRWAGSGVSQGEQLTAQFVLAVWDRYTEWEAGHFDAMKALAVWDFAHREAFLDWATDPWWS